MSLWVDPRSIRKLLQNYREERKNEEGTRYNGIIVDETKIEYVSIPKLRNFQVIIPSPGTVDGIIGFYKKSGRKTCPQCAAR